MRRYIISLLSLLMFLLSVISVQATTVYYQPTPYATTTTNGVHLLDGWVTSVFYGRKFIQDDGRLQVGGWSDIYRTYLKFDLEGLPTNVSTSTLRLMPFWRGDNSTTTAVGFYRVTSDWTPSMTWSSQPTATLIGWRTKPEYDIWWGTDITSLYNGWQDGTYPNYGLRLDPDANNNKFDDYRSSQYTTDRTERPMLELDFVSPVTVPGFELPLPGNLSWLVSTEPGGWDCVQNPQDSAHTGANYFSIDFPYANEEGDYQFTVGGISTSSIPVVASASGKVVERGTNPSAPNGYYVVVDHDSDNDANTGFTTRYLHFKYVPAVNLNDPVAQGDLLGFMGNTGISTGTHLHFGTRYDGTGASTSTVQYVTNEGLLLKSYQTECDTSHNFIRYYPSTNQQF